MSSADLFIDNLDKYFGINNVTQPDDFIKAKLNIYFFNVIGENYLDVVKDCGLLDQFSDGNSRKNIIDFLIGGNKSVHIKNLINNKKNNNIVNKFNKLVLDISINFNSKYYEELSINDKNVFIAYLVNNFDNLKKNIKWLMDNDSYWNQYLGNFGFQNVDFHDINNKFIRDQIDKNVKMIPLFIELCTEIKKQNIKDKNSNCIIN